MPVFGREEDIVGKGENVGYKVISLRVVKTWDYIVKSQKSVLGALTLKSIVESLMLLDLFQRYNLRKNISI